MKEYVQEKRRTARRGASADAADGEADVLASIEKMSEPDRTMAAGLHALIKANAPSLVPRTWYGMPAYSRDGNVICFFQNAGKFKARYSTLGFSDKARLDEGNMWPASFAIMQLTPAEEARIVELLKKAVG
jgi:uncharacterized protein YdhG (YjbR/CyaY superfamily)